MDYTDNYELWLEALNDENIPYDETELKSIRLELMKMTQDEALKEDAFYRELDFGTAGLRGILGAGTNRMNSFTVAKATQGLANYVLNNYEGERRSVAISYDSRNGSENFARVAARVLAASGVKAHIYKELMPTPCLSFAVRELKCAAGIMVTASHNPPEYNGYKVYNEEGCQITSKAASDIVEEIKKVDIFKGVNVVTFEKGISDRLISYISDSVYDKFIEHVLSQSHLFGEKIDKNVSIVYSPLNGTGLKPVVRALTESGYDNIFVVPEQEKPDGNFPTCHFPNPENRDTMELGIKYAKERGADILIATDPDADRCGIAIKSKSGDYALLSGNEIGIMLIDYLCGRRQAAGKMPKNPLVVKSIVTSEMVDEVAASYGVKTVTVLTGFKYIGEVLAKLEREGREDDYILGFEESYGYLSAGYVRDKDAVDAAFLIAEMFAYYKTKGISIEDRLTALYEKFGYRVNPVKSYQYEGSAGLKKMGEIMENLRRGVSAFGDYKVLSSLDYEKGVGDLPKANVLQYKLDDRASVIIRPSGTEPKIKVYVSTVGTSREDAEHKADELFK
ncbi:MAG: phospho-sugar mutase, partial [Lachnospiraceae bacterium]|nr:phospho-sugar mutase [Lachnospiraceae bacterium]